jgi:hypothetical protein
MLGMLESNKITMCVTLLKYAQIEGKNYLYMDQKL